MAMFDIRGLEFHSSRMWQWSHVEQAVAFLERTGMNALVFHQNDLVDQLVFPAAYFSEEEMWRVNPVRMHTIFNNRHYIGKVVRHLRKRKIGFYVEVKELWYPDEITGKYPHLLGKDGVLCPFDPFWSEFLSEKYTELFRILPDIDGIIMSAGTRESRISISASRCTCSKCRESDTVDWYETIIKAVYAPIAAAGKTLVVRDFSYSSKNQRSIIEAADRCSNDIVISLKNTPHDYYPTFPDNPSIGECGDHPQWVEFDGWGQFFGIGVFPCSIVEDLQKRFAHAAYNGVKGIFMRTDWEVLTEASIFNSLNMVNLFAAAIFSQDTEADSDGVYRAWIDYGLYSPLKSGSVRQEAVKPGRPEAWLVFRDLMRASWKVIEKSQYVRGHLFNEDDQYCNSVQRAYDMMVHIHGRDDWEPGASRLVQATDENIAVIMAEKRAAVEESLRLRSILSAGDTGLPDEFLTELKELLDLFVRYTRGFEYCAAGVFFAKKWADSRLDPDRARLLEAISELERFAAESDEFLTGTDYPHYIYWLLDMNRIRELVGDLYLYKDSE